MAYIVTIEPNGQPHVLGDAMHEADTNAALLRHAHIICRMNPIGTVVWALDADGEYPQARYERMAHTGTIVATTFAYHPDPEAP